MKLLDLFSGIGGFSLAAKWTWGDDLDIVGFCEIDKFCQKVLNKNFPGVMIYDDIHNIIVDINGNLLYIDSKTGDVIMGKTKSKKYDTAVSLYESGLSIQECADYYGISRQGMHKILKIRDCKFRNKLKFGEENHFYRNGLNGLTKKKRVRRLVEKAIKKGILIRKTHCEQCNNVQKFKDERYGIQAHHNDYDKPLEVVWLCQKCHHEWHKNNKAKNETDGEKKELIGNRIDIVSGGFP